MRSSSVIFVISAALFFFITACTENDPVTPQEDHFNAIGIVLRSSGIQLVSILRGGTADTLHARAGVLGDRLEVFFHDENEQIIDPPKDPNKTLAWEVVDVQLLEVHQDAGHEGGFEFHLKGVKPGMTTLELFIMHEGHADYRSGKIPVSIN